MKDENSKLIKIQPSDIVSGSLYLKLLEDYQAYDKIQKEYISSLESRVSELTRALEEARLLTSKKRLLEKLERRKKTIRLLTEVIKKMKIEKEELIHKIVLLNLQIQNR